MKKAILKQEVERTFGRQLTETRDFEQLSHLLLSHTRERLSPTSACNGVCGRTEGRCGH